MVNQLEGSPEADVIAREWPDGMPAEQRLIVKSLGPEKRRAVIRRLDAIHRIAAGESPEAIAVELGLGRSGLFKIRRRWAETRSLEALVPNGRRSGGRPRIAGGSCSDGGGASPTDGPSLPTRRRLDREERRRLAMEPRRLTNDFGRRFAGDLVFTDVPIRVGDHVEWAMVAVVIETASGLILSGRIGPEARGVDLVWVSLDDAHCYAIEKGLRVLPSADGWPELSIVYPTGERTGDFQHWATRRLVFGRVFGTVNVRDAGNQRFGRAMADVNGLAIGRIRLRSRGASEFDSSGRGRTGRWPPLTVDDAQALLDQEVAAHNVGILGALGELGLVGGASGGAGLLHPDARLPSHVRR